MAPGFCTTRRVFCVNTSANSVEELDKLADAQSQAKESNVGSNKALIKTCTLLKAPIPPLVSPLSKDLFTKFMKVFIKAMQDWNQEQLESQKRPIKARTTKTYFGKSHIYCYHFYLQCEDYFKISGTTKINCTQFAATYFYGTVSLRWAQYKCRHKNATPIIWPKFKFLLQKDL